MKYLKIIVIQHKQRKKKIIESINTQLVSNK